MRQIKARRPPPAACPKSQSSPPATRPPTSKAPHFSVKTGADTVLFGLGLKNEVTGTGVFGKSVNLSREGTSPLTTDQQEVASQLLNFVLVALLCWAVTAAGL